MKKLTFSKSLFLIFEVKYIKKFSLEHILKSAGEVSIVENYVKICLVGLKIVCCHGEKKWRNFGKIISNTVLNYF
jgi:hypothetical protein